MREDAADAAAVGVCGCVCVCACVCACVCENVVCVYQVVTHNMCLGAVK